MSMSDSCASEVAVNDPDPTVNTAPQDRAEAFLSGGGEAGALMRSLDWSATPFGAPDTWPQSLRSAVSICLGTKYPIAIYWGPDLALLYNDAWSEIPGEKHPWALGRAGKEVWPEIWDAIGPLFDDVQTPGEGVWQEDQLLPMHRHGYTEECYFNFTFSPIRGENGNVEGIFNAVVETTFRVIGERRERTLRELAECVVGARSEEEVFRAAIQVLGSNREDIPFCMVYLYPSKDAEPQLVASTGLETTPVAWPATVARGTNGPMIIENVSIQLGVQVLNRVWPEAVSHALLVPFGGNGHAGGPAGFIVVGISPRRALDEDYEAFVIRASGHIGSAITNVRAFEEERRRAESLAEIDRAKTTFFSNVSHEFRTPLTLMLGPIEDALADSDLLPRERERVEVMHRNGLRLLKLVNSLLDFSRVEAGKAQANVEPVDLARLTVELASNFRSAMEKAGLSYHVDCPTLSRPVLVDRDMWEKIVLNLLSNAFKFTLEGEVTVEMLERHGMAVLTVRDTGTGIPAAELPKLFERFHRVEGARGRSIEGSGIGLALVQELVRFHGGHVEVRSREGEGTSFIVSVPLDQSRVTAAHDERVSSSTAVRADAYVEEALRWLPEDAGSTHVAADGADLPTTTDAPLILLADDNADMRDYVRRLLSATYQVEVVEDGVAALEAVRKRRPDLLLTDIMMPRLDGFGLIATVRDDPSLADLPIIALSARSGEEAKVDGLDAGADDYLVKPFSARELVATVRSNLELSSFRREATITLQESEARFRNMADHAPVMMWVTEPDGSCTYLNRGWYDFTGQTEEEGLGQGWLDATHPDDRAKAAEIFLAANDKREPFRIEYRLRRADGEYRWAIDAAAPRFADNGTFLGYIGSVIDIMDRKRAEEKLATLNTQLHEMVAEAVDRTKTVEQALRQSQKMEAIGQLTGGIAHDFNNLLQVISGNLQLLGHDIFDRPAAQRRVANALEGVARGSKLASQLLSFGRRQPLEPKVVNIGRFVAGMEEMLQRTLGEGIEIEIVRSGGLWNTFVDVVQIENAVLNLAINARDAMDGGGKLTIEVGNALLDDEYARQHDDVAAGQYVMLALTDTGSGMAPEIVAKVFDPFFTTKPVGKGTGLGLSMVHGFVKQSGGHVKIYSEMGEGTSVKLYFPRSHQQEDAIAVTEQGPVVGGTETILVAEDDENVRETVVAMLTDLGYRVLKAKDASAALNIIESGVPIDLLFTDVVMPGPLKAADMARQAKERMPELGVLFTSGYTENSIVHGGRLDVGVELLSKPYSREAMARKIRHVLNNALQMKAAFKKQDKGSPSAAHVDITQKATGFASTSKEATASGRKRRVLLVEDNELISMSEAEMLGELGYDVVECASAEAALLVLEKETVDILVSDLGLPGISGEDLCREVRRRWPEIAIVFATGMDKGPELDDPRRTAHLRKPHDLEELVRALDLAEGEA